ncbi:MAG TPA: hypothetical protein PKV20_19160, partial [Anaerolineae bacterium]|nr:hypothetical protein [Anaerolineae bacterium]
AIRSVGRFQVARVVYHAILLKMTRKQRLILILLGVLDVSVIALLAGIVIHDTRTVPAAPTPTLVRISACEQKMLDALAGMPAPLSDTPAVAWDEMQLYITLKATYPTATPPEASAQLLWTTLDRLASVLQDECTVPETISIALTAQGTTNNVHYLAQLAGRDVIAWMEGTLPEEDLAAQSRFRKSTQ